MATIAEVRAMLAEFIGDKTHSVLAKVKSVDEGKLLCVLDDDGTELYDVRLCPIAGATDGVVLIPEVGSFAMAMKIEGTEEYMVVSCTKVAKALVKVGNQTLKGLIDELFDSIKAIQLNTPQGPTTGHVDGGVAFDNLKAKFDLMFG